MPLTRPLLLASVALLLTIASQPSFTVRAQSRLPLEGVWDEIALRGENAANRGTTTPNHMRRMFFDGYYSLSNASEGRQKLNKPVTEMTREELLDRFQSLQVQDGTYQVMGPNKILLKRRISQFPQNHGTEQVMEYHVEGDTLTLKIISDTGSAPVGQVTTYRRMK